MKVRVIGLLLFVALSVVYTGFIIAHRRFDESGRRRAQVPPIDGSAVWRLLIQRGMAGLPEAQKALDDLPAPKARAELALLLPRTNEPWLLDVQRLLSTPPTTSAKITDGIEYIEPRNVVLPGPLFVTTRCAIPGWVSVQVLRLDVTDVQPIVFDVAIGQRSPAPLQLEKGSKYRVSGVHKEQPERIGTVEFEVLSEANEVFLRSGFETLKRWILDTECRRFAQSTLAMQLGVMSQAKEILADLEAEAPNQSRRGIDERLLWIYDHLGVWSARDRLRAKLETPEVLHR